jgi:hypothetical protein
MEFTTHFELHSQTTRLFESASQKPWCIHAKDGILTLYDAPFQETCAWSSAEDASLNYNSDDQGPPDFKFELFPLHSQLLGESLLVSFPPLIDMLKFSG